MESPDTLLQ